MSPRTAITTVAATTAGALLTLGAAVALSSPAPGDTTVPPSSPGESVVPPAGTSVNRTDRDPTDAVPAATAIEYGLIAAAATNATLLD